MLQNFVKDTDGKLIFTGHYMEFYIPEYYFENSYATIVGATVNTLGLLHYTIFDNKDKEIEHGIMNLPTFIIMYFTDIESISITLSKGSHAEPVSCKKLKYYKNDPILNSNIQKDSINAEKFLKMICGGKIQDIPYDKLLAIWYKNIKLSDVKFNVPASIFEIILAQLCRNKNNIDERFGVTINKNPKISLYDYSAASLKTLCSRTSTFAALSFQDMDYMMTSSLNMNKYNKEQSESPLEKIMKY